LYRRFFLNPEEETKFLIGKGFEVDEYSNTDLGYDLMFEGLGAAFYHPCNCSRI
jgi:hypothetical protein